MLILQRAEMQRIRFDLADGQHGWLTVCSVESGRKVRLGFELPANVSLTREELLAPAQRYEADIALPATPGSKRT